MEKQLEGKVAIITGASERIGSAVAQRFAKEGALLILVAKDINKLNSVYDSIQELGGDAILAPVDLEDFDTIKDFAMSIENRFKSIDILILNAAVLGNLSPVQDYEYSTWNRIMNINFTANWYLIKCFDPLLKLSPAGRIIATTSEITQSLSNYPYWSPYASSKAALETMMKIYATETKHSKLCINMVYPSLIDSGIYVKAFPTKDTPESLLPESFTDKFVELSSSQCNVTGQVYQLPSTVEDKPITSYV
ncbi:short chain dehydrogenase/reductase family oxidoreductase [Ehrlichia ruminantium]|uniref:SDR family NAD(P)-dependent oxidoreductase n=1 Tax=Ehrlichia ruminantium TaxID=779 RepID=UPI0007C11A5E|nr:SDR family oxidoreductase [Ehrlichia ruminantium]QLK52569.1 SDR family oxidoreductase [Ehrlichia ruminantium]QLK53481.1 SDR family oxidoreductase [Ehrlichia ruminantium]QLK54399.1 SDR family oxidoreductase [Ehrlichia ruminantium]QLK57150.1 SDR family oxidoreductase [Ehrlichia ruminantium]QLK58065.1 SDR family oxidoreductase [Ehrlichia ruminantium]